MKITEQERKKVSNLRNYWITRKGHKSIPQDVLDKLPVRMQKFAAELASRKVRLAKYGPVTQKQRYHAEKHNNQKINVPGIKHLQIRLNPGSSKNWHVQYIKRGHTCSSSTSTTDKKKAMTFAVSWYNETVLPSILSNDKINVLDTIKKQFTFLGESKWNSEEYGFLDLPDCACLGPGVYAIMRGDDVLKIGKADGVRGLRGRLKNYKSKNKSRVHGKHRDSFTIKLNENMNSAKLKGKSVSVYYFETKVVNANELGIIVPMTSARGLEKQLSMLCRNQGHSMALSGSD